MPELERLATLANELEELAAGSEARALLELENDPDEWLRLKGNRSALHHLAASLVRATLQPGEGITTTGLFQEGSDFTITEVTLVEELPTAPAREKSTGTKLLAIGLGTALLGILVLAVIGALALVRAML